MVNASKLLRNHKIAAYLEAARVCASQLLTIPNVSAYIEAARDIN